MAEANRKDGIKRAGGVTRPVSDLALLVNLPRTTGRFDPLRSSLPHNPGSVGKASAALSSSPTALVASKIVQAMRQQKELHTNLKSEMSASMAFSICERCGRCSSLHSISEVLSVAFSGPHKA